MLLATLGSRLPMVEASTLQATRATATTGPCGTSFVTEVSGDRVMHKAEKLQQVQHLANLMTVTLYDQWLSSVTAQNMKGVPALDLHLQTIVHIWNALITRKEG